MDELAKLISYGVLDIGGNALGGYLTRACCEFCGKKFGSVQEARRCEVKHINEAINREAFNLKALKENS